jgi:hypothetical protein
VRLHAWLEQTFVAWDREPDGYISYSYGGGVSFDIAQRRLFIGGAYEQRFVGDAAMFTIGVPLGDLY